MKRIGWSMFRKIYWWTLFWLLVSIPVVAVVGENIKSLAPFVTVVCSFFFWLILGRRIAFRLVPLFVSRVKCPGCHEEISSVSVWNCACGFNDHREQHLFSKRCPKCGRLASHIDCPRCSSTILLW
jgi:hypothetical protein